jgi:hypothetical protein
MEASAVADIVCSILQQQREESNEAQARSHAQRAPRPSSTGSRGGILQNGPAHVTLGMSVTLIENNQLITGSIVSLNRHGWAEITINGINVARRTLQLLLPAVDCPMVQVHAPPPSTVNRNLPTSPPTATVTQRPMSFSWLYVPLISRAEALKYGTPARPTCFNADVTKQRVGASLFDECASLLAQHLTEAVTWQDTYITAPVQERIVGSINDSPQFQQLLYNASHAVSTPSTPPAAVPSQSTRQPKRRPRDSPATSTPGTSSSVAYVEGEDL